ncbi:SDR family oxidoreductase [Kitasatospora sp. NRRL B-11411]|uniref:SDR family oxidoreductase n=1 Tax=Kitasatospora sp. NRRL B-11411 TaxID=1463822 RepID=UPI0004C40CF9|nr:SDR family oxidoreductase [Kitasatospora sp. NRRL B-11411]
MSKIWFITGASRGLGRSFTEAALSRGDKVAATARDTDTLKDLAEAHGDALLALPLDVTDRHAVHGAVTAAHEHFGRLDVVVNNAGYGLFGMVEEVTEQQARTQLDTNFFGALHVTQAALPLLRAQGSGHIVQISSLGGVVAFPSLGIYNASKWALEGMTESLAQEVAPFGIRTTLVEPGGFGTDWGGSSAMHATPIDAYQPARDALAAVSAGTEYGDPKAAGLALLEIVDAERPPLRVLFGAAPHPMVKDAYAQRLRTWADWEHVSAAADGH